MKNELPSSLSPFLAERRKLRQGMVAGLVGGFTIWVYEFFVLYVFLKSTTVAGIVQHTAQLLLGSGILRYGVLAFVIGLVVHTLTAIVWAVLFAFVWPQLRRWGWEASFAALPFGVLAWVVMHLVILARFSPDPPVYTTYVVINGLMSHMIALMVPVALVVKTLSVEPAAK